MKSDQLFLINIIFLHTRSIRKSDIMLWSYITCTCKLIAYCVFFILFQCDIVDIQSAFSLETYHVFQ